MTPLASFRTCWPCISQAPSHPRDATRWPTDAAATAANAKRRGCREWGKWVWLPGRWFAFRRFQQLYFKQCCQLGCSDLNAGFHNDTNTDANYGCSANDSPSISSTADLSWEISQGMNDKNVHSISIHIFSFKILLFFISAFRRLPMPNAPTWSARRFLLYKFISSLRDGYPLAVINGSIPVSQPRFGSFILIPTTLGRCTGAPRHCTQIQWQGAHCDIHNGMDLTCPLIRSGYLISLISCTDSLDLFFIPTLLCNARYYTSLPWSSPEDVD
jgi:hypothetical protein